MVESLKLIPENLYIGVQICMLNAFKNQDKTYIAILMQPIKLRVLTSYQPTTDTLVIRIVRFSGKIETKRLKVSESSDIIY